jgi:hypothetical protein
VSKNEIDLIDPDYTFPKLVRGNLAYDRQLFGGWIGTAEFLFSKTMKEIRYQNLNLVQTGTRPDGRPVYAFAPNQYGDVILLTNTGQGHSWTLAFEARRPWSSGWFASASYLYGQSKSNMDGTNSQAASNWGNAYTPGDPNNLPLTRSNFDPGHRVNVTFSRTIPIVSGIRGVGSVFYSVQSGRPYSLNFSSDYNGDGRTTNDLVYIPRNADEVIFRNGTFDQFMTFIKSKDCYAEFVGKTFERNACRAPWINTLDFKFSVGLPTGRRTRSEIEFDLNNLANLFNREWGLLQYANFNDILVARTSIDAATGKAAYDIGTLVSSTFQKYTRDDLKSRWQGQIGLRLRF